MADPATLIRRIRAVVGTERPDYVWAAGEATTLKPVRRYLRCEAGHARDTSHVVGYWRRGSTSEVYDGEVIARGRELLAAGADLTARDLDELGVEED